MQSGLHTLVPAPVSVTAGHVVQRLHSDPVGTPMPLLQYPELLPRDIASVRAKCKAKQM